jgi:hypothetical protein
MTTTKVKPPMWFWIVSVLAFVWNIMGVIAYLGQAYMPIEDLEKMSQAERLLFESQPAWVTGAFAIAVWGGTLGCLLLLLRKTWARPILLLSLVGIIAQLSHSFFMSNAFEVYGPGSMVMPLMVLIIGVGLLFLSKKGIAASWLT